MTYEELKAEANAQGYNLVKISPKIQLENCPVCGAKNRDIHIWFNASINESGYRYQCDKCDFCNEMWSMTRKGAKLAWNDAVSKYKEVTT